MGGLLDGLGSDAGLLAAAASAFFLLYTAVTMAAAGRRKRRSISESDVNRRSLSDSRLDYSVLDQGYKAELTTEYYWDGLSTFTQQQVLISK